MSGRPAGVWVLTILAGSLGAVLRYAAVAWLHDVAVARLVGWSHRSGWSRGLGALRRAALPEGLHPFPGGVLLANTVAVLVDGVVLGWAAQTLSTAGATAQATVAPLRVVIVAGLAGGLSTLSTLAVDVVAIWGRGQRRQALAVVGLNLACGALALAAGLALGRAI